MHNSYSLEHFEYLQLKFLSLDIKICLYGSARGLLFHLKEFAF